MQMYSSSKLQIYKGMIQYLLDSPNYTLKRIAALSHTTLANIRAIHSYDQMPVNFSEERHLVQLYQIILEQEKRDRVNHRIYSLPAA